MLAKSITIALAGAVALGLSTATFATSAMAADAKPAAQEMKKTAKIRCGKLDKASQDYKDCKAKQAAARKAKNKKTI